MVNKKRYFFWGGGGEREIVLVSKGVHVVLQSVSKTHIKVFNEK